MFGQALLHGATLRRALAPTSAYVVQTRPQTSHMLRRLVRSEIGFSTATIMTHPSPQVLPSFLLRLGVSKPVHTTQIQRIPTPFDESREDDRMHQAVHDPCWDLPTLPFPSISQNPNSLIHPPQPKPMPKLEQRPILLRPDHRIITRRLPKFCTCIGESALFFFVQFCPNAAICFYNPPATAR